MAILPLFLNFLYVFHGLNTVSLFDFSISFIRFFRQNKFPMYVMLNISYVHKPGLRTPNEGINQRYLKNWADVADLMLWPYLKNWDWD